MDINTGNIICDIINSNRMDELNILLRDYDPLSVIKICVSGWITEPDKIMHMLTKHRHLYTDGWLMSNCAFDLETHILESMHNIGINLNAEYKHNKIITNYFTQICQVKLGINRSSVIIVDNIKYLHKINCVYLDINVSKANPEAQFCLAKIFTC